MNRTPLVFPRSEPRPSDTRTNLPPTALSASSRSAQPNESRLSARLSWCGNRQSSPPRLDPCRSLKAVRESLLAGSKVLAIRVTVTPVHSSIDNYPRIGAYLELR
jgi:hypothetical protein